MIGHERRQKFLKEDKRDCRNRNHVLYVIRGYIKGISLVIGAHFTYSSREQDADILDEAFSKEKVI